MSHFLQTGDTEQKLGMFLNRKKKEAKKEKKIKCNQTCAIKKLVPVSQTQIPLHLPRAGLQ